MRFSLVLGDFWCSIVTSVNFSRNLRKFEKKVINKNKKSKTDTKKIQKSINNLKFGKI